MGQQTGEELITEGGEPELAGGIGEQVGALAAPEGDVQVGAVAGELIEGLGLEAGPQAVAFSQGGHHHAEEGVAVCGGEGVIEGPVDLELTVGVLVVGLIRTPAQGLHRLQQFGDQGVAAHQRQLVVAGFLAGVSGVGDGIGERIEQEELGLHAGAQMQPLGRGPLQLALQHQARRLRQRHAAHRQIGGHPGHLRLPGQLGEAGGIGAGQHVGVGRGHLQPGGETGEARATRRQFGRGGGRHQLGALHPEQVAEGEEEMAHPVMGGEGGEVGHG